MTDVLFNKAHFLTSLADDEELARELLEAFLQDSPERTSELEAAIAADNAPAASKLAHSLKGMCGVVRSERLLKLALEMEHLAKKGDMEKVGERFALFTKAHREAVALMRGYMGQN